MKRRHAKHRSGPTSGAEETVDERRRRLHAAFLELPPGEQAKLLDRAGLRENERVLAGTVLEQARGRFFIPVDPEGHRVGMPTAIAHVADALDRAGARDPVEEMLVTQMMWAHSRVAYLTTLANKQDGLRQIQTISEALERAHNTCRRLALALADYRRPPRQFIAARQFNQAGQQVVQNNAAAPPAATEATSNEEKPGENRANEKGLPAPAADSALPPIVGGAGIAPVERRADEAVAADARPSDGGGQGAVKPQRVEARRAER